MRDEPRGAGTAGGLLFVAVLLVVAYLVVSIVSGILKVVIGAAFVVVAVTLAARVLSRR